jgi:hypothetical protein
VSTYSTAPDTFLGVPVPDDIKAQWKRWEGAEWRTMRHMGTNNMFPPDQRYSVRPPQGMCQTHHEMWIGYRNQNYDPRTGNRWPGHAGSMFTIVGHDIARVSEERRVEWDRKASEQMQLVERICLRGDSPQCSPAEPETIPAPRVAGRAVQDVLLPNNLEVAS